MKEQIRDNICVKVDENISYLKELFKGNADIVYREFCIENYAAAFIYIDGMADKLLLDHFILKTVMTSVKDIKEVNELKNKLLAVSDIKEVKGLSDGVNAVLSGDTMMFVEGLDVCYVIATRLFPARSVAEPSGETVVRGSREGFTEVIRFNTALIRRRIRDTRLKIATKSIGERSKTDVAILSIDDIVNKTVLDKVMSRIDTINIDAVLDSGYIAQLIEDNKWSLFPQIQSTERPDVVAAALYEGRVVILVDNSPFAIIIPATLPTLFQSPDDYYQRTIYASSVRIIRFLSIVVALVLTPLYVAFTSFHTAIIPTKLAYSIAATREGVPFPAFIEAIIMEISLAFLMEAVVRLPKPIGSTIGIVGGLIIGQAAVTAGIVSPFMIIIVSITAITSFITPSYELTYAFRMCRFILIIAASIIGLYGIMIGLIVLLIHLAKLKSFGIPYLEPFTGSNARDLGDTFIRKPIQNMKRRPEFMKTGDKIRQK